MDIEAQMAKALEGQFFWAPFSGAEEERSKAARDIKAAQRVHRVADVKRREEVKRERARKVLLDKKATQERRLPERLAVVQGEIARMYGIPKEVIMCQSRVELVSEARHHFLWSLIRYFPKASLSGLGRIVGRHHSTIIHSRRVFEAAKGKHAAKIAELDAIMGYTG